MIITFQAQIDPLDPKDFSEQQLAEMEGRFNEFLSSLESFREYIRGEMYVDGKAFHSCLN